MLPNRAKNEARGLKSGNFLPQKGPGPRPMNFFGQKALSRWSKNFVSVLPGAPGPPRSRPGASREPFWSRFGPILEPLGLHFQAFSSLLCCACGLFCATFCACPLPLTLGYFWLQARWPVLGAQPPAGSGHRASSTQCCSAAAVTKCVKLFAWLSPSLHEAQRLA